MAFSKWHTYCASVLLVHTQLGITIHTTVTHLRNTVKPSVGASGVHRYPLLLGSSSVTRLFSSHRLCSVLVLSLFLINPLPPTMPPTIPPHTEQVSSTFDSPAPNRAPTSHVWRFPYSKVRCLKNGTDRCGSTKDRFGRYD